MTAWRCAFILLENRGLKITELTWIVRGLPPLKWPQGLEWPVLVILLCILPQRFMDPLLTGGIDWTLAFGEAVVRDGSETADSSLWYWYLTEYINRRYHVCRAAGLASVAWMTSDNQTANDKATDSSILGGVSCRRVMPGLAPIDSILKDAIIPCIQIHNITWPEGEVPRDIWDYTANSGANLSLVNEAPFTNYQSGVAALINRTNPQWNTNSTVEVNHITRTAAFPKAMKFSGNMTVVMYINRQPTTGCKPIAGNAFGNSSYITQHVQNIIPHGNVDGENCFTYGTVYFTAGVIHAPSSRYISPRVVEYYPTVKEMNNGSNTSLSVDNITAIEPSIWTQEALWMMSDVMTQIAIINTSSMPTWDNLENYTASLIRHAYMANWDAFHLAFDQNDTSLLTVGWRMDRLWASVSRTRLFAWFGVTLLVPVSGVLMRYLQMRHSRRAMITDEVAVLLTDPAGVIEKYPFVSGMVSVTEEDEQMGRITLEQVKPNRPQFRLKFK